jgi:hypothetical protein
MQHSCCANARASNEQPESRSLLIVFKVTNCVAKRLRKNSRLHLFWGGAALQRCGKRSILIAPLGAEAGHSAMADLQRPLLVGSFKVKDLAGSFCQVFEK